MAREWLLGHWAEGAVLNALGLWVSAGTLAGRLAGTGRRAATVLRATARTVTDTSSPN